MRRLNPMMNALYSLSPKLDAARVPAAFG